MGHSYHQEINNAAMAAETTAMTQDLPEGNINGVAF